MMFSQRPMNHTIFKQLAKALISLSICAGWSEPLLVAHTTLLEISCHGSFYFYSAFWVILHDFLSSADFFQNQILKKISFSKTIRDPDQARHFFKSDLVCACVFEFNIQPTA